MPPNISESVKKSYISSLISVSFGQSGRGGKSSSTPAVFGNSISPVKWSDQRRVPSFKPRISCPWRGWVISEGSGRQVVAVLHVTDIDGCWEGENALCCYTCPAWITCRKMDGKMGRGIILSTAEHSGSGCKLSIFQILCDIAICCMLLKHRRSTWYSSVHSPSFILYLVA